MSRRHPRDNRRARHIRLRRARRGFLPTIQALEERQLLSDFGDGLAATYYDNMDLTGPAVARVDPTVDFDWGSGSPDPAIGPDTFSARWDGQVVAPSSETYTFYTQTDDGARLWVNGQLLIDDWTDQYVTENSGTIALVAGQNYSIRLEYYDDSGGASVRLLWGSASTPKEVIPQSQLFSTAPPALSDAGFEAPSVGSGTHDSFATDPTGTAWAYTGWAGVTGNDSGYTAGNPNAPEGAQVAFLETTASFSQDVPGWAAGTYAIDFLAAQRGNFQPAAQDFQVLVDGAVVGTFTPTGTDYLAYTTAAFTVTAGMHTITFQGLDSAGSDNTAFIDDVQVAQATTPPLALAAAVFKGLDTATQGNWRSAYGGDGYDLAQDTTAANPVLPAYATLGITGAADYTWATTDDETRALQDAAGTGRIAGVWYAAGTFDLDLDLTDGQAHQVALYALDYDGNGGGRSERIDVLDAATGAVLDSETVSSFQNGTYLVWDLTGDVTVQVTNLNPNSNAVVNGIFFGAAAPDDSVSRAVTLVPIATDFNSPIGIDYLPTAGALVVSVYYNSNGSPHNFDRILPDGSHTQFSSLADMTDEVYFAVVPPGQPGGWTGGTMYAGNGAAGQIVRVAPDGSTVTNPWVTLPGETGLFRGALTFDTTGVFGGDLIAVTYPTGDVWRVNSQGQATKLVAGLGRYLEGATVVPNDPDRYGPLAGTIVTTDEQQAGFYTVDAAGHTAFYNLGIPEPEDVGVVPAGADFYGVNYGAGVILGASWSDFTAMVGDLLIVSEVPPAGSSGMYRVFWAEGEVQVQPIDLDAGSAPAGQWEHFTFAPVGVKPLPPPPTGEAALAGAVYADANNDGRKQAGEPGLAGVAVTLTGTRAQGGTVTATATTAADGSYHFDHLWPGTYALTEDPPAGYVIGKTTAGTLGGTAGTITITGITPIGGGAGTGYDFGMDRPPLFTTTLPGDVAQGAATGPLAVVPAGSGFAYQAAATDPDGDPRTYTLLAGPDGMQFDPDHPGLLTWSTPSGDDRDHRVAIRVDDGRGGSDEQDFTLRVATGVPNRPPIFTSRPVVDAYVDTPYTYHATASDPDFDPLTFAVAPGAPAGLTMPDTGPVSATDPDPDAGVLRWTPSADQLGPNPVEVDVSDGQSHTVPQAFTVVVHPAPGDHPPVITSTPPTELTVPGAETSAPYGYHVRAVDPDGDPLTYHLMPAATGTFITGAVLDAQSGWLTWDATPGTYDFLVQADDGRGGWSDPQPVHLTVTAVPTGEIDGRVGIADLTVNATDAIFLAGRTDVTIPLPGQEDSSFPLIRTDIPGAQPETFPQAIPAAGGEPFSFRVSGGIDYTHDGSAAFVGADGDEAVVDDGGAGFTLSGTGWGRQDGGYGGTNLAAPAGDGSGAATWEATGLPDGDYDVAATWQSAPDLSTDATYLIYDGAPQPVAVTVDQKDGPNRWGFGGTVFQGLGTVHVTGGTLRVVLPTTGDGAVDADAVMVGVANQANLDSVGGISGYSGPLGLVGVFLNDRDPSDPTPPSGLDFTEFGLGMAFTTLAPQLGQVFFIGDGRTGTGTGLDQQFLAPAGATRLFLGIVDGAKFRGPPGDYDDNNGAFNVQVRMGAEALPGRTVYIDQDQDGTFDPGEPSAVTDQDGRYQLTGLGPGSYTVAEVVPPGWLPYSPASGTQPVALAAGQRVARVDFGDVRDDGTVGNQWPSFQSTAPTAATVGQPLRYAAAATDPDADPLTFDLPVRPAGMGVDPATGTVVWTPAPGEDGAQYALLRVRDGRGGVALQPIPLTVAPADQPPVITSTPPPRTQAGFTYQYQARAVDPDGDPVTFQVVQVIDEATQQPITVPDLAFATDPAQLGLLTWTAALQGSYQIVLTADDGRGGVSDPQVFDLTVATDPADGTLRITSDYRTTIPAGRTYLYRVTTDEDGQEALTYSLVAPPAGAAITADGLLTWIPTPGQAGPQSFQVVVSDHHHADAVQPVTITVTSQPVNGVPTIDGPPPDHAVVGRPYAFTLTGSDPDHDPLVWGLPQKPAGMAIDPLTGVLTWTPTEQELGPQTVVIQVADGQGGVVSLPVIITVAGTGLPPRFTTAQPPDATQGVPYAGFQVQAVDPDGGAVTYVLVPESYPAGMRMDPTGAIAWLDPEPDPTTPGFVAFTVQAEDDQGQTAVQPYVLAVDPAGTGAPPQITSGPAPNGNSATLYQYQATADDPAATFSLEGDTWGWAINSGTGLLQSVDGNDPPNPAPEPAGPYTLTIVATNAYGTGELTVTFTIQDDTPPAVTVADGSAIPGVPFTEAVQATAGLADDPLTYALAEQPTLTGTPSRATATLDAASGYFAWTPDPADPLGRYEVQVIVTDAYGMATPRTFHLDLGADTTPPAVQIASAPQADVGRPTRVQVQANDPLEVTSRTLTVTDPGGGTRIVPLDAAGFGTVTETLVGTYTLTATATDAAGLTGSATAPLTVLDPSDANAPVATLDTPADQATVTAPTRITGTVSDPALIWYTLAVAPLGSDAFTPFYTYYANPDHHSPAAVDIADGVLDPSDPTSPTDGLFDPTTLADGTYTIRLTAYNAGNWTQIDDHIITVAGSLKLGNLHLSFTDLSIPLAGIPITITRTYDTLDAGTQGDFGYGWTLSEGDVHLQVSTPDGTFTAAGDPTPFSNGTHVEVTLPGQDPEGFTFYAQPEDYGAFGGGFLFESGPYGFYHPTFLPDAGVLDTLTVPDVELTANDDGTYAVFEDDSPYNPATWGQGDYTVTTRGGTAYVIDAATGTLASVSDRNGNTLTYDADGITSSTGVRVLFHRDAAGRIDAITDPRGHQIIYHYDPTTGDLAWVTDRAGATTTFVYGATPHVLDHVVDPTGHTVAQASYTDGRVSGLTDAAGNTTALAYDLNSLSETVTPPAVDGTPSPSSTVQFDALGNVTGTTDALGNASSATYYAAGDPDGRPGELKTQTQTVAGQPQITIYTYYPDGLIRTTTDPAGHPTTFADYDAFGQPGSVADADGNTTAFQYDGDGNLIATTTPDGLTTAYTYNPDGQVHTVTTLDGTTTYEYYGPGDTPETTGGSPGELKSTTARGVTTNYTYDANGNPLTSDWTWVDPNDASHTQDMRTTNVYDADDRLIQATDPAGVITDTIYDAQGRATWTDAPHLRDDHDVDATQTFYDADGRVVATEQFHDVIPPDIDPVTGATNQPLDTTHAVLFSASATVYDPQGRVIWTDDPHQFDPDGKAYVHDGTHTIYDADGRVLSTERYHHVIITLGTDAQGAATTTLDTSQAVRFSVTSTVYDEAGRVIWTDDPHDPATTPDGTHTTYDDAGRVESTERYAAVVITLSTDPATSAATHGDPIPSPSSTYDPAGRTLTSTDARGYTTQYTYDGDGNLTQTTAAVGTPVAATTTTTTTYVQDGHATTVHPDGTLTTAAAPDTTDDNAAPIPAPNGRTVVTTAALGRATTSVYDQDGNLTDVYLPAVFDPANPGTLSRPHYSYTYDVYGDLTSETVPSATGDPDGATTTYTYDAFGRKLSETTPMGQTETWTYNGLGQLAATTDFDGHVITYGYDPEGRVKEKDEYSDATAAAFGASAASKIVTYTYDNYDTTKRLRYDTVTIADTASPNDNGETRTYYDTEGDVAEVDSPQGDITYTYDAATGRRTGVTTANTDIRYTYDLEGRLATVTADTLDSNPLDPDDPLVTHYFYDDDGNLTTTKLPNGTVEARTYDPLDRLTSVVTTLGSGEGAPVLAGSTYTLDPNGRRTSVTEQGVDAQEDAWGRFVTYGYDADGRLSAEEDYSSPTATTPDRTYTYSYDLAGNRHEMTDSGADGRHDDQSDLSYQYNADGQLIAVTGTSDGQDFEEDFDYYDDGNTKTDTVGGQTTTDTWDLDGRMIAAVTTIAGTPTQTVTDAYDDAGDRISETVTSAGGSPQTTTDLNDPIQAYDQVLEEYQPGGVRLTYVRGLDLIFQDRSVAGTPPASTLSYFVVDGLGSTRALTGQSGTVTDTYTYDAYGALTGQTWTGTAATPNEVLYASYQYDTATLRYHTASRDYNPVTGGFDSRDTEEGNTSDPITENHYLYASGDPANMVDPSGHDGIGVGEVLATAFISGALSAGSTAAYGYAKNWSTDQIARASLTSFFIGAAAGGLFAGTAAGFSAAGISAAEAWAAAGLIYTPAGLGLAIANAESAFSDGDITDQVFASLGVGLAAFAYGTARSQAFALAAAPTAAGVRLGWAKGNPVNIQSGDKFTQLAGRVPHEPGVFDLYQHTMNMGTAACEGAGDVVDLLAIEATLIKAGWQGEPIRLFACRAGDPQLGATGLAQQLAKFLGVRVKAPTEDVILRDPDGTSYFITNEARATRNTGTWRWFEP